jgi:hypothetical protein
VTGEDDDENASPSKKGKGKRGRKDKDVENETGKYHISFENNFSLTRSRYW